VKRTLPIGQAIRLDHRQNKVPANGLM